MASYNTWVFRRGVLWSADLSQARSRPIEARVAAEFRRVGAGSLPQLIELAAQMDPIPPTALVRRVKAGRQCFAGWVFGNIAAYGWLTCGPEWVGEFEREINVREGEAYIWDCATAPAHRRQRLFSTLIAYVADQLQREGLHRLWSIAVINTSSMRHDIAAAGFSPILNLTYARLHDKRFLLTVPAADATSQDIAAGRRLVTGRTEQTVGPLIVGNTSRPAPPETHFDR